MFNYSEKCTVPLAEHWSSRAALAMGSSWSLFQFSLYISDKIFCSIPVSSTPFRAHTTRDEREQRSHCRRLCFRDQLSSTVCPVCP